MINQLDISIFFNIIKYKDSLYNYYIMNLNEKVEMMLYKYNSLLNDTKTKRGCYLFLYNQIFYNDMMNILQDNDKQIYNNQIYMTTLNGNTLFYNFKIDEYNKRDLEYIKYISDDGQKYINNICDIILDENYNIKEEIDTNIILYYYAFKLLDLYYNLIDNLDNELTDKINKLFRPINNNLILFYKCIPSYPGYYIALKKIISNNSLFNEFKLLFDKNDNNQNDNNQNDNNQNDNNQNDNNQNDNNQNDNNQNDNNDKNVVINKLNELNDNNQNDNNIVINKLNELNDKINILMQNQIKEPKIQTYEEFEKEVKNIKINTQPTYSTNIPSTLRNTVWTTYINENNRKGKCFCCRKEDITTANFECGHVISRALGGADTLENLRPLCSQCNKSMSSKLMHEFIKQYGFWDYQMINDNKLINNNEINEFISNAKFTINHFNILGNTIEELLLNFDKLSHKEKISVLYINPTVEQQRIIASYCGVTLSGKLKDDISNDLLKKIGKLSTIMDIYYCIICKYYKKRKLEIDKYIDGFINIPLIFKYIPDEFKTKEMCENAVKNSYNMCLQYVPDELKTKEMCENAVKNSYSGICLQFVPDNLKTNEMCDIAIQKSSSNLEYVPDKFKK